MSEPRYAIYFTPARYSALERFGASVLGYDCYSGEPVSQAAFGPRAAAALPAITAEPRRYGFHATLKPPFRLAPGFREADFISACNAFAETVPMVAIGLLQVAAIGRFLALTPVAASIELSLLAAECVATLDRFRAPPTETEIARRRAAALTVRQTALLGRWGYPHVFDQFRFHMTLTSALEPCRQPEWLAQLSDAFKPLSAETSAVDALTILRQGTPADDFVVIERVKVSLGLLSSTEQVAR